MLCLKNAVIAAVHVHLNRGRQRVKRCVITWRAKDRFFFELVPVNGNRREKFMDPTRRIVFTRSENK